MSETREPTGPVQPTGFERITPPKRPRFDELFAGAIEEQLSEQRTLNELLGRVDATLHELRQALLEQPDKPDDGPALEVLANVERSASALAESFPQRLQEMRDAVMSALTARDDVDRLGSAGMLRRLEELREELVAKLAERDEAGTAAVQASIETLREQANDVGRVHQLLTDRTADTTKRLEQLVESASSGQQTVIAAMESATARIETLQHDMRDRLSEIVASLASDLQQASASAATAQAEQLQQALAGMQQAAEAASAELPSKIAAAAEELRTAINSASAELPARVDAAAEGLRAVVEDATRRLGEAHAADATELNEAAATLARVAAGLGPAIATTTRDVRNAMREAVDEDRSHVEESLRRSTDEMRTSIAGEVQRLSENAAGVLAALQRTTSSVGAGFTERIEATGRGISEVVTEVREALVVTAEADRQEMRDALTDLRASAKQIADELQASLERADASRTASAADLAGLGKSVRAVQGEVEQLVARFASAVAEQEARARTATDGLGERVEVLLENFRGATAAELSNVQRTVATLREELEHATRDSAQLLDKVVARLEGAAAQHVETARTASSEVLDRTRSLEDTASRLARVAGNIEPALAETAGEVLAALRQTAKDDRAQMRDGIARVQQSAERMGETLQSTMVRHIDAVHAASTAELAGANQSLAAARRALEDSATTLTNAVARQASDSGAATGAQVAQLQGAVSDLRSLLERTLGEMRAAAWARPAAGDQSPSVTAIDEEALAATLSIFGGPSGETDEDDEE